MYPICCTSILLFFCRYQAYQPWGTHWCIFVHLLIRALQGRMHTIPPRNSYLASVHLPTSATAQRHNPEQGTQGHWVKSAWLDGWYFSFSDSIRVAGCPPRLWLLIYAELLFCPHNLCETKDLNFYLFILGPFSLVGCPFFYFTVFTPSLPDGIFMLTVAASLQITFKIFCCCFCFYFCLVWGGVCL